MRADQRLGGAEGRDGKGRSEPTYARRESGVLPYDQLTDGQKKSAEQALRLLADLATLRWEPAPKENGYELFLPRIDRQRWNSVVLLDGGRGSGKTTLFVSMLAAWASSFRDPEEDVDVDRQHEKLMPRHPADKNVTLRCLVPLEILDLHPLPASTNLSLYIAERFHRVVEALRAEPRHEERGERNEEHRPRGEERGAWPFLPSRREAPRTEDLWRKFIQAAASGWDGNLNQRKASLDPEDYARELEETERRRLAVPSSFYEFLDALTFEFSKHLRPRGQVPLFVVPIDDADMNPQRSVELLAMLRALWHPRVVFLLTGDTELFLATLRADYLGQFRRNLEGLHTNDHRTLSGRADHVHLAEEVYRRVIPPGHRCELPPLPAILRLSKAIHLPIEREGVQQKRSETELSLLSCLAGMRTHAGMPTIAQYMQADEQLPESLPDRLRGLRDLLDALRHDPEMTAWEFALRLWREAVRRATLTPEQRRVLSRAVRSAEMTQESRPRGIAVATKMLNWSPLLQLLDRNDTPPWRGSLRFQRPARYEASLAPKSDASDPLPASMIATLMLACDIAADDPQSYFIGPSPMLALVEEAFATAEIELESLDQPVLFVWPLPDWVSFHDVALFAGRWEVVIRNSPVKVEGTAPIARGFLEAIVDTWERRVRSETEPIGNWDDIADRLAKLASLERRSDATPRDRIFARWAMNRAALIGAPEAGVPSSEANAYLDAWRGAFGALEDILPNACKATMRERHRRLRQAVQRSLLLDRGERHGIEERLKQVIEELDDIEGYTWSSLIEGRTIKRDQRRSLLQRLDAILVAHQPQSFTRQSPSSVDGYVRGDREQAFLASGTEGDKIAALLDEFHGTGASAAMALAWSVAVSPDDHTLRERVRSMTAETGQIHLELDASIVRWTTTPLVTYPLREGVIVHLGYSTMLVAIEDRFLNALYRVTWDVAADEQDLRVDHQREPRSLRGKLGETGPAFWDVIAMQIAPNNLVFPWFVPPWPALFDSEALDASWTPLVSAAAGAMARPDADRQVTVDALAHGFLAVIMSVAEQRRQAEIDWTGKAPSATEWQELIQRIRAPRQRKYEGRRWRAFEAFREALLLMAAPESGLSFLAAEAILGAVKLGTGERRYLQELRRARARHAAKIGGFSEREAKTTTLAAIDAAVPTHPWDAMIKRAHGA